MQKLRQGVLRRLSLIGSFFRHIRELGLKVALRKTSNYLGITVDYFSIEYPIVETPVMVSGYPTIWKDLECEQWEFNCIKHVSNVIKEGQILLDVGAWIGPYTLLFAKLVQDTGRVYAFEPDPEARRILRRNMKKNGLTNVKIQEFAISNFRGKSRL